MPKRIYFDYAASTPVDVRVEKAMRPYFSQKFGNPSSPHSFGQEAMAAVDKSRGIIAKSIGAEFDEIIFTGSATESNNLALRGITQAVHRITQKKNVRVGQRQVRVVPRPRLIVSAIEHESVLETARDLAKNFGVEVIYLPVDKNGMVNLKTLQKNLNERTILVSVMYANNEIGTTQPISAIAEIVREFRMQNAELRIKTKNNSEFLIHHSSLATAMPLLHTDAVQAFQFLDCDVNKLGVDVMTLSAHKIYGPKGVGALYARKNHELGIMNNEYNNKKTIIHNSSFIIPIIFGGNQEFGLHSGTENVAGIVGFAKTVELAVKNRKKEIKRVAGLRGYFWCRLKKIYPKAQLNQTQNAIRYTLNALHLPNILNIYFPSHSAQDLLIKLDLAGIAASSGSACSTRSIEPSHVLKACGLSEERIKSSLRFSFGRFTTKSEISAGLRRIQEIVK